VAIKSFRDRNPYLIGIGSVLFIALAVAAALLVGVKHLGERVNGVQAVFADSGGIAGSDPVLLAGVKVGRVTKVRAVHTAATCARKVPDPNVVTPQGATAGCVMVSFVVNQGIHLGAGTRADIVLETLLGGRVLRLSGPVDRPYLESLPAAARVIGIDRTEVPFDIFDLVTVGAQRIEATDTAKLNQLIKQLADVSAGKREQITTLLTSITQISGTLNARDAQVRQLLDRAQVLSQELADKDHVLVSLIDQSQGILRTLQRRRNDIALGLTEANGAVAQLDRVISTNKVLLDSILSQLHPLLNTVGAHEADLNATLAAIGPGINGMALSVSHGPWQDIFVKTIGFDVLGCTNALKGKPDGSPLDALCTALLTTLGSLHLVPPAAKP
jgi:phospholipid/cholesterol/gamma-HCH transport system substrate-binding protein